MCNTIQSHFYFCLAALSDVEILKKYFVNERENSTTFPRVKEQNDD